MSAVTLTREQTGRVLLVRIANPPRHLMTPETFVELAHLVDDLRHDREIRAVVLSGAAEDTFITHFDVGLLATGAPVKPVRPRLAAALVTVARAAAHAPRAARLLDRTALAPIRSVWAMHEVLLALSRLDQVVIAAINGLALGGGCELALACDLRYIADRPEAIIGMPEAVLGVLPGAGGTQRLARAIGHSKAIELLLEGSTLGAHEAMEVGLVHRVCPPDRLLDQALETAHRLARRSPRTIAGVKRAIYDGATRSATRGMATEATQFIVAVTSSQGQRGMSELARRYPADVPVPVREYLERIGAWQAGTEVDLGAPAA